MENLGRIQEDVSGENLYYESDLTEQMREKIRNQAARLRQLEQYRVLCEQRIQDLCPDHTFPVKSEDIGQSLNLQSELQMAKKKIARLESQIHNSSNPETNDAPSDLSDKYERLLKDKNEVEASLRAEMLVCEEQRTYIEVLKQALEEKNESLALSKVESQKNVRKSESCESKPQKKDKNIEKDIKNIENDPKNKTKNAKQKDQRLKHLLELKEEEFQSLLKEKQQLEKHLAQADDALQAADEEISKLEEEKQNLLDYVDEHSSKEQKLESELNSLSQHIKNMKSEIDYSKSEQQKAKTRLEQETKLKDSLQIKIETLSEELYKSTQVLKDLQSTVNDSKSVNNDKDLLIKRLKEEKLALEIRVENLQANSSTLAETLKETQSELENIENELKETKKSEISKVEALGKLRAEFHSAGLKNSNFAEEIEELKKNIETLKRENEKLEKNKESEQKQNSELKSAIGKLKVKCESLEELEQKKGELERFGLLTEEKLNQLQEDYEDLQEAYSEIQQRELIQTEALNELRKHNSELSREVEELYRENQKLAVDYSQKSQSFQEIFVKCEKTVKNCERLENEKKNLETQIRAEKNQAKQLLNQTQSDQYKSENLSKTILSLQDSLEKLQKKSKTHEDEISNLKLKLKTKERELEEERFFKLKLSEDLQNLSSKSQTTEKEFDKLQTEVIDCCKIIAGFAGKYTVLSSDSKHSLSQGYKEFLLLWKDQISTNCSILSSWVQNTVDEIENMSKQISELQKTVGQSNNDLLKLNSKLEDVHSEDFCNKQEQNRLRTQIENWMNKYESFVETAKKDANELKLDLAASQKDLGCLLIENNSLRAQLTKVLSENQELKTNSEVFKSTLRTSEEKISSLKNEKIQLEGLVKQVQRTFGSSEISKIHAEISRIKPELEVLERERLNFECQLLKFEADPRSKESLNFKDLNSKLVNCERQITNYKRTLMMLQEDVNKEQMIQNLRLSDRETLKSGLNSNNLPKSVSILSSRHVESSKSLRKKSSFE